MNFILENFTYLHRQYHALRQWHPDKTWDFVVEVGRIICRRLQSDCIWNTLRLYQEHVAIELHHSDIQGVDYELYEESHSIVVKINSKNGSHLFESLSEEAFDKFIMPKRINDKSFNRRKTNAHPTKGCQ